MPCQSLVEGLNKWYASDAPDGLVVYNVLAQQNDGSPAQQEDAANWHDVLGLDFDVLADDDGSWQFYWGGAGGTTQHSYTVIDSSGKISWRLATGQQATLEEIIQAAEAVE